MADQALDDLRRPEMAGFSHLRIQDPKRPHDSAAPQLPRQLPQHDSSAASPLTEKDAIAAVEVKALQGIHLIRAMHRLEVHAGWVSDLIGITAVMR